MEETQIQQKLAENLPKSEPELNPQYPEPEQNDPARGIPLADYVMKNEVFDYFGIGTGAKSSPELGQQINDIIMWAKSNSETPDLAGILRTLRHAETSLGNQLKPDRMARLYRFVKIQQQKSLLAEKERALYA